MILKICFQWLKTCVMIENKFILYHTLYVEVMKNILIQSKILN
jgi:hypothetical protein